MQDLFTLTDCAKRLGVAPHRINYALQTGKLADADLRLGGKRAFTATHLKAMASHFGVELNLANNDKEKHE